MIDIPEVVSLWTEFLLYFFIVWEVGADLRKKSFGSLVHFNQRDVVHPGKIDAFELI